MDDFRIKTLDELTSRELYAVMRARAKVFTVEQKILYPDADGVDERAYHVFCTDGGEVVAYLRLYFTDEPDVAHIGRVLTTRRGLGLGKRLMQAAENFAFNSLNVSRIDVEAQRRAEGFYLKCGYSTSSEEFYEVGVPHIKMTKTHP